MNVPNNPFLRVAAYLYVAALLAYAFVSYGWAKTVCWIAGHSPLTLQSWDGSLPTHWCARCGHQVEGQR